MPVSEIQSYLPGANCPSSLSAFEPHIEVTWYWQPIWWSHGHTRCSVLKPFMTPYHSPAIPRRWYSNHYNTCSHHLYDSPEMINFVFCSTQKTCFLANPCGVIVFIIATFRPIHSSLVTTSECKVYWSTIIKHCFDWNWPYRLNSFIA